MCQLCSQNLLIIPLHWSQADPPRPVDSRHFYPGYLKTSPLIFSNIWLSLYHKSKYIHSVIRRYVQFHFICYFFNEWGWAILFSELPIIQNIHVAGSIFLLRFQRKFNLFLYEIFLLVTGAPPQNKNSPKSISWNNSISLRNNQ